MILLGFSVPVSLCMIAKNEELFLGAALRSARTVLGADDLVVVDTGSTDRTIEIALENGAKVFDFAWCDDFSAARNYAADRAQNDWVLMLDADEEITGVEFDGLAAFMEDDVAIGSVTLIELYNMSANPLARFYNRKHSRYEGSIHEQVEPVGNRAKVLKDVPVVIEHHGYMSTAERVLGKLERNERLLKKELELHPGDPYLLYQLGKSFFCDDRDLVQACEYFEKVLAPGPDVRLEFVYNAVECLGYALINTGQYEKALELVVEYAEHYNSKPQFRFLSGHVLQNNGLLIEAVEAYESCIGAEAVDYSGVTSFLSYYNIGVILECVGMAEDAIRMYESCGDYEPALLRLAELRRL